MTPRSFFAVLIKIIGINKIFNIIKEITQFVSTLSMFTFTPDGHFAESTYLIITAYTMMIIGIYLLIIWVCVFKAYWIIDLLKLDKGFTEDKFEFTIQRSSILKIALIIIGGVLLIDSIPLLINEGLSYFKKVNEYQNIGQSREYSYIVINSIKAVIGFLLISLNKAISNFIEIRTIEETFTEEEV